MLSLQVEVNGNRVAVAGCADAESIDATVTIFPGLRESWVRVAGEIVPAANPPADALWFQQAVSQGDRVTITLVNSAEPTAPKITRTDPSAEATDEIPFACSFCGKLSIEIEKMYAGLKAQICNECVQFMHDMAVEDGVGSRGPLDSTHET
jgi:hypothetical protein